MRYPILGAAIAIAIAIGLVASASGARATELLFNFFVPPAHLMNTKIMVPWTKAVEKATDGRVTFKIPPRSIAPPPRQFDIVRTSVSDMAYQFNAFLVKRVPLIQIGMLPLLYTSAEAHAVALWRTYKKFFEAKHQYKGVVLLGFIASPDGHMCSMGSPIRSVADLRSKKMWSLPGLPAAALKRLDVVVVPGPAVRAYQIVSKGIVDGFSGLGVADAVRMRVAQFAKSCTIIPGGVFTPNFSVMINPKRWASLSDRDRKIIRRLSGEALARRSRAWDRGNAAIEAKLKLKRIVAPKAFQASLRKAWTPMHEAWIAQARKYGVDGRAALDFFVEQAKAVEAERGK